MSGIRSLTRRATAAGSATAASAPIFVDSDDNRVKTVPTGTGTTEVILQEALGASMVETLITTRVLTAADSGKTFFLNLVGGFTVTLPAASTAPGFHANFVVKTAPTTAYIIITNAADLDTMTGSVYCSDTSAVAQDTETTLGADQMNFVASVAVIGDQADVCTDGANWYGRMYVSANGGGTFTN